MPTGYTSLTKNQKQEIDAMTVLLVMLTQWRFYWSCLRNDGIFISKILSTRKARPIKNILLNLTFFVGNGIRFILLKGHN